MQKLSSLQRSNILRSVTWLKEMITSCPANHRLLDSSWHLPNTGRNAHMEYIEKHIPGALFFDIDACADTAANLPHMIPGIKKFEEFVGALGINNDTHVVLYDNNPVFPLFSAQRTWWLFRLFGHENVSILEGGLPKWLSEGGKTTVDVPKIERETFKAAYNEGLIKHYKDIEKIVFKKDIQLVDARPEGRFKGTAPEPREDIKPGCIPSSLNIPFMDALNIQDRTVKTTEELQQLFKSTGVDLNKPLVVTCGTGVSACVIAVAAFLCGKEDVSVYDGSWTEWYSRAPSNLKKNVPLE